MYGPKIALSVEVTNWPQRLDPITAVQLLDNLVAIKVTDFLFIDIIDALAMATIAVRALALTYCPEIAAELESQQPAQITPGQNQVTNEQSQVTKCTSAAKNVICAYMAGTLNQLLGVDHWAKVFADFWCVPNLSQSFFQLNKAGKEYTADIDKALAAAARSCDQLAQTKRGKELLGKK